MKATVFSAIALAIVTAGCSATMPSAFPRSNAQSDDSADKQQCTREDGVWREPEHLCEDVH